MKDSRIICAAIRLLDGGIFQGDYHGQCIQKASEAGVSQKDTQLADQGFITDCGRFVNRKIALGIATKAGQIKHKHKPEHLLLSEDYRCPN